jgi:hypothetical protein
MPAPLTLITTLARSGALDRAWALFRDGGYDRSTTDPAALAVKGRLLKDRAWRASGEARATLLGRAALAYSAADVLDPQPYLLINAAACHALGGDSVDSHALADVVLDRVTQGVDLAETPYWLAATRAEALLIKGDLAGAQAALIEALEHDPDGYEEHAVTLRQFKRLIIAAHGDATWLDAYRPPASLHFSGHLAIAETQSNELRDKIDAKLSESKVGFGYGALAAGADIVVAEALIARGAELHLVLPAAVDDFRALSVAPYGAGWLPRFDACLAAASSVRIAAELDSEPFEPLATALASDIAMGAALLNARRLESRAVQLLVVDEGGGPFGGGQSTARDGGKWLGTGLVQHVIVAPRTAPVAPSSSKREGRLDRRLAALIRLDFAGLDRLNDGAFAAASDRAIEPFLARILQVPGQPFAQQTHGNAVLLAFPDCGVASCFAREIRKLDPPETFPLRMSGHYGLILLARSALKGPALSILDDISLSGFDDAFTVSEAFATALQVSDVDGLFDAQYCGDIELRRDGAGTSLFTLIA